VEAARVRAWSADQRAALMRARLVAAQTLIEAGQEPASAAALIEATLAIYDAAPSDMLAAGLDPARIEALREAVESAGADAGVPDALIEADEGLGAVQALGGNPLEMIGFLARLCAESFDAGVSLGEIRRPLDYQTSYGLAVIAREAAGELDPEAHRTLQTELRMLVLMWPAAGPISTAVPAPDAQMAEQFLRIRSVLAGLP
jgi:hypothetical protein